MDMIKSPVIAAAFAASFTLAGAAAAQPAWWPSWNPDIAPTTSTTGISADTTGSMQTSTNNPDRSMPAFDAQSGPRAVTSEHGYYTEHVAVRTHRRHHHRHA
jgi:hypothetical protein